MEAQFTERFMTSDEIEDLTPGKTVYGCPDCGGSLLELDGQALPLPLPSGTCIHRREPGRRSQ
jgi:hypothetical protein